MTTLERLKIIRESLTHRAQSLRRHASRSSTPPEDAARMRAKAAKVMEVQRLVQAKEQQEAKECLRNSAE